MGFSGIHATFRMTRKQRLIIAALAALAWIVVDQITKALFRQILTPGDTVSLLAGSLVVFPVYNHGAFLSFGAGMSGSTRNLVFVYGVLATLAGLLVWLVRSHRSGAIEVVGIASILGGGLSNLLDRCLYDGRVFDFLNMGVGPLRTGIFNIADVGIMVGVTLLIFGGRQRKAVS
jgi:signal peptidase II